ncbi:MAG: hypothetical protein A2561_04160 [Candidatus Staskawiczbacteria bacterium RIFOXYD1_FULL_32_13]|uniref:Uncharacterized protein n=1 Tax=Candidatus Staskawiczbacteria bacterium RIFOXYD1_FULL_32_13 TaxID=1802234 RepID=A0A1G2JK54_9BACT|nr:MAG: hypothetical protein A2561_04160 [Candidatus Staskawiczbacteria bacterium RIFOXYD1_FULL_32_13]
MLAENGAAVTVAYCQRTPFLGIVADSDVHATLHNNSVAFFALVEAESATGHNQSSFVPEVVHGRTDCVPDDPADDAEKNDNARKKGDDIAVLGHKILQTLKHRTVSHVKVLGVGEEFPPGKFCFESERFDV